MREFELVIDEALRKGLSPEEKVPFNTQVLANCLGFRCGKAGLEAYETLDNPLPITVDMFYDWPFPQFIAGKGYGILVIRDTVNQEDDVYSVSEDHQTITSIFNVDELTFGKGTPMEVADFGEYIFMTNGVIMIYWDPALTAWFPTVAVATIPMMRTVCNFKGQAVGGNIVSAWHDCDETFYIWSKIGSMDFTPDENNEAGYRRCPYGGEVYHVRRIGDHVVGYSSKGITLISPVLVSPVAESIPTFGFKEISDIGLINRGAMNGNLNRHVYVGEDYILREITSEGIRELGYEHFMKLLAGEDIIVNYDPSKKDFYIGNSTKTFLLSPYGLTEVKQHPSAVWRRNNETNMIPDVADVDSSYLCSEAFDIGYRGQKTIFSIESDIFLGEGIEAGVDYTHDLVNWHNEYYKPINDQGVAAIIASGNAFRFRLRFATINEDARIGYIKARYKMTDLRGIRGVYAPSPRGQVKGD
ncbi:MAG: hypothetical protein KKD77_23005 [Gammaproteobacteria bacterium]|nr:hypothetical protein [Gammaproteobacteria bacterium]